jgi:type II secretory pathway pseudopilin PulG
MIKSLIKIIMNSCRSVVTKHYPGMSLIEVLVAVALVGTITTTVVSTMPTLLSTAQFEKEKNLAEQKAKDGIEFMRQYRDQNFSSFSNLSGTYCLDDNNNLTANCSVVSNASPYLRRVIVDQNGCVTSNVTKVTVNVSWRSGKCTGTTSCHKSEVSTCLSRVNAALRVDAPPDSPLPPLGYHDIPAQVDAFIDRDNPDCNSCGRRDNGRVDRDRNGDKTITYLKFNFGQPAPPAWREIVEVRMRFLVTDPGQAGKTISINRINNNWGEGVNWNRKKNIIETWGSYPVEAPVNTWLEVKIDNQTYISMIQGWITNRLERSFAIRQRALNQFAFGTEERCLGCQATFRIIYRQ